MPANAEHVRNGGGVLTWGEPLELDSAADSQGFDLHTGNVRGLPFVIDRFGKRHQIWGDGLALIATRDRAGTWGEPVAVGMSCGKPHGCSLSNGSAFFVWSDSNRDVWSAVATRDGWQTAAVIRDVHELDEAVPCALDDGSVVIAYEAAGAAWVVVGEPGGVWSTPQRVSGSDDLCSNVDPCARALGRRVWLTFHHESSVWWTRSEDGGRSWLEPSQLLDAGGIVVRSTADPNFALYGTETSPRMLLTSYLGNEVFVVDIDAERMTASERHGFDLVGTFPQIAHLDGTSAVIYNAELAHTPGNSVDDDSSQLALWMQDNGSAWSGPWLIDGEESSTTRRRLGRVLLTADALELSFIEHSNGRERLFVRRAVR